MEYPHASRLKKAFWLDGKEGKAQVQSVNIEVTLKLYADAQPRCKPCPVIRQIEGSFGRDYDAFVRHGSFVLRDHASRTKIPFQIKYSAGCLLILGLHCAWQDVLYGGLATMLVQYAER